MSRSSLSIALLVWVSVANPHGIRHGPHYFGVGQRCLLTSTQDVTTHGTVGDKTRYRIEAVRGWVPQEACPPDTVFLAPAATFARWQREEVTKRKQP